MARSKKATQHQQGSPTGEHSPASNDSTRSFISVSTFAQKTKQAIQAVAKPRVSSFSSWDAESLRHFLAQNKIELRDSAYLPREVLVRICEEVGGADMERDRLPQRLSVDQISQMDVAARRIQQPFFRNMKKKRREADKIRNKRSSMWSPRRGSKTPDRKRDRDAENSRTPKHHSPGRRESTGSRKSAVQIGIETTDRNRRDRDEEAPRDEAKTPVYTPGRRESSRKTAVHVGFETPDRNRRDRDEEALRDDARTPVYTPGHRESSRKSALQLEAGTERNDQEIEKEWRKPSWKRAKFVQADSRPHHAGEKMERYNWRTTTLGRHCVFGGCGEQLDLWDEGQISEFTQFGSGITNYFKFLKWCCWIMAMLTVLHLPVAVINAFGVSMQYSSVTAALTTFGNLGASENVTAVFIPGCNEAEYQQDVCQIDKSDLAIYYSYLDAIGAIIVIIGLLWLRKFERTEVKNLNRKTVTASDFSVCVQNIPRKTTEDELAAHFAMVTGEDVAAVNLAFDNEAEIKLYFERGDLMRRRYECVQQIRYEKSMGRIHGETVVDEKKLSKLLQERERLSDIIQRKDRERMASVNPSPRALQAFVTFETEAGFIKAVAAYQLSWIRSILCFYPGRLRFRGHRLKVTQAPEPSTIIWENLGYSKQSRSCRKFLTTFVAILAMLLSVVATFLATDVQQKTLKSYDIQCPADFSSLSFQEQVRVIEQNSKLTHCYCSRLGMTEQRNDHLCSGYFKQRLRSMGVSYGASMSVVAINTFFTILMDKAGGFEKHHSLDAMETSIMVRIFLAKFINTAVLLLLYNQKWLQTIVNVAIEYEPDFGVKWYQIGGSGLMVVMLMNIVVPHMSPLIAYKRHVSKIKRVESTLTDKEETDDTIRVWYSQEELNQIYVGPPFTLNYRYAQTLVTFFVCWMYSISMPIMPLLGALSFCIQYWVDKFLFCNYYKTPPRYSDSMGRASTNLIGWSVIVHLCMSLWMMGSGRIFKINPIDVAAPSVRGVTVKQAYYIPDYLRQKHMLALEVVLIVYVVGILVSRISVTWYHQVLKVFRCLVCTAGDTVSNLKSMMNTVQISYTSAKERGIIKGLATYNILQNPKYQEAFAISAEFAERHSRLSAIHGLNTKEGFAVEETPVRRNTQRAV